MAAIPASSKKGKFYLYPLPISKNTGIRGLRILVRETSLDVKVGDVFIFFSKDYTVSKLLVVNKCKDNMIVNYHYSSGTGKGKADFLNLW